MIDVELRNCIECEVAIVQSRADKRARNSARNILLEDWVDVSQNYCVIIVSANNTTDVLV